MGATLTNDFIELANAGSGAAALDGWSVQYISASPGATTTWQVTPLTGSLSGGGLYLIGEAAGTGGTTGLPPTQASGSINMSGTSGTVALVDNSTPLTCKTAADCAADSDIVDLVGYGTAVIHEGSADAPGLSNTTSAQRITATDTDQNGTDFTAAAPTPGAPTAGGGAGGGGTPGPLAIHDIQGTGFLSPQNGNTVTNVPGIVTGVRAVGSSRGYWIQDPSPDSNPATSEGIFVFTSSAPTVASGDSVLVSGKVQEFYPLASGDTVATTSNLSITEIDQTSASVVSSGNALPAPIVLGPDTVPGAYAPDLGGGNIESTAIQPARSALDFYESIEGMRVEVDNARVVGPSDSFAEQYITTKPDQDVSYRGGTLLTAENATPSGRLEVVAANGSNPEVSVGDVFTGATVGPIDYSQFGGYFIAATTLGAMQDNHLAPVVATAPPKKQLSIATYNVENLAPSNPDSKFQALAQGIVTNLASPDIIAVEEVQDNDGATKKKGEPALSLSPGRIDPGNAVWNASRKPLVGQFEFNGKDVFVIANHFDSTLGDQSQDGRFQFPAQSSAVQRAGQALVEHNFVNQILAIDKKADVVVVGDLNDYQFSPALSVLKTGTSDGSGKPTLTDLITTLPASQQYTYDFDGVSEVLDHILITKGIGKFTHQVVHVNAEFANQVSDHDPQVVDIKP